MQEWGGIPLIMVQPYRSNILIALRDDLYAEVEP